MTRSRTHSPSMADDNNSIVVKGIGGDGLLPRILKREIPDDFFNWGSGRSKSSGPYQYQAQGYTYFFSKESVSTAGQEPPYIRYLLRCSGTARILTVYVYHPEEAGSLQAVRFATWAAFNRITFMTPTTYMYQIDAQEFKYAAEHAGEAQAQV